MNCGLEYCIYNKAFECTLEEIGIDDIGMCDCCCLVYIENKDLQALKDKQLKDRESYYKN